jgi:hypothetical protein
MNKKLGADLFGRVCTAVQFITFCLLICSPKIKCKILPAQSPIPHAVL